jgi:hypothetical protein
VENCVQCAASTLICLAFDVFASFLGTTISTAYSSTCGIFPAFLDDFDETRRPVYALRYTHSQVTSAALIPQCRKFPEEFHSPTPMEKIWAVAIGVLHRSLEPAQPGV